MANNAQGKTTQEYLNDKAGFVAPLRTIQECMASLSGRPDVINNKITLQNLTNSYAGTSGKITQDALNDKVGSGGATLTKQEAARRL